MSDQQRIEETVLATLYEDHGCIHHAGANTGPCRTCKRRAAVMSLALSEVIPGLQAQAWHYGLIRGQNMQHIIETEPNAWPDEMAINPYGEEPEPWRTEP